MQWYYLGLQFVLILIINVLKKDTVPTINASFKYIHTIKHSFIFLQT